MRKKVIAVICLMIVIFQVFSATTFAAEEIDGELTIDTPFVPVYLEGSYGEFLQNNARTLDDIDGVIYVDVPNPKAASDDITFDTVDGRENVLIMDETGFIEWEINVQTAGLYVLGVDYYTIEGKGGKIERSIYINGELQYNEARTASLDRNFIDEPTGEYDEDGNELYFYRDKSGNETRTKQVELNHWVDNYYFQDSNGSYTTPLKFYLKSGVNTIRLESVRDRVAIEKLYFYTVPADRSYTDFLYEQSLEGYVGEGDQLIAKVQAEYPSLKSDSMLFATFDRSSAATEPPSQDCLKLNIMGGDRWKTIGQWVEYEVDVPEAGLYKIVLRYRQNLAAGLFSSREITVNGELPYDESSGVQFPYSGNWGMVTPEDEYGDPVLFKFNEGTNTIRIKAVTGELNDIVNSVENIIRALQEDYRKIAAVIGTMPDNMIVYDVEAELPEVVADFRAQGDMVNQIYNKLLGILGEEGQYTAQLDQIADNLYYINENPSYIASRMTQLNNDISSLGDFMSTCREQPLEIDYIMVAEKDYVIPDAEADIFSSLVHQAKIFFASFYTDLNTISGDRNDDKYDDYARIWTTTARDYAIMIRQIIDRSFIPEYGIDLDFQLFPGSLTNSVLAGDVCEAMIQQGPGTIQDMAARHVIYPFNFFETTERTFTNKLTGETKTITVPGFKEIKSRYPEDLFGGVTIEMDKDETTGDAIFMTYGIPETVNFSLLYYRTDICSEYNIPLPDTWDDYYTLIPLLQKYNMNIAAPDVSVLIYQYGGTLYRDNGRYSNIDSDLYLDLFVKCNEFITQYKCPISYDALNRFKTGEMPIVMGEIGMFTTLSIFSPEIKGLWAFEVTPGVEQEDGSINRDVVPSGNYTFMLADSQYKENGWAFIQWWTNTETQVEYGRECESLVGQTARYNSANREAFMSAPWKSSELEVLLEQFDNIRPKEVCFGDYMSARYISFAKTEVLVEGKGDGRETILSHMNEINRTIQQKREELGLPE